MVEKTTLRRNSTESFGRRGGKLSIVWTFPPVEGRVTALGPGRTVLGRDFACDIRLPGEETSRQHAEILREGAMLVIGDLGSTNGVFVDGRQTARAPLEEGSVIRIGDWVGVVVLLEGADADSPVFTELVPGYFAGPRTRAAFEPLRQVAASDLSIIVQGETGTGKEGVARATHAWSGRGGAFVAVNCAALPETLAEGELFGYRKGAFTNADRANPGFFQAAHRGTLFLDEVAELSPLIQPKLLRALEQHEVTPLGEAKAVSVDVRVVVATQAPLADAVRAKRFRADLLARLDGLQVKLPPLRERVEEVPQLFSRLLAASLGGRPPPLLDPALVEKLCCHDWPLNIRELNNLARRMAALHGNEKLLKRAHVGELEGLARFEDAAGDEEEAPADEAHDRFGVAFTPEQLEDRRRIIEALDSHAGSQTAAARALKISRGTLIERLKRYNIRRPRASRV